MNISEASAIKGRHKLHNLRLQARAKGNCVVCFKNPKTKNYKICSTYLASMKRTAAKRKEL